MDSMEPFFHGMGLGLIILATVAILFVVSFFFYTFDQFDWILFAVEAVILIPVFIVYDKWKKKKENESRNNDI